MCVQLPHHCAHFSLPVCVLLFDVYLLHIYVAFCVSYYTRWKKFPVGICPWPFGERHLWWTHRQPLGPPHITLLPGAVLLRTTPLILHVSWSEKEQRRNALLSTSDQPPKHLLHTGRCPAGVSLSADSSSIVLLHKFSFSSIHSI